MRIRNIPYEYLKSLAGYQIYSRILLLRKFGPNKFNYYLKKTIYINILTFENKYLSFVLNSCYIRYLSALI